MAVTQLTNAPTDGTSFGQSSTDKICFYGGVPATRPSAATTVATSTITTAATSTTPWGFATSTQADAVAAQVVLLRTALNSTIANLNTIGLQG